MSKWTLLQPVEVIINAEEKPKITGAISNTIKTSNRKKKKKSQSIRQSDEIWIWIPLREAWHHHGHCKFWQIRCYWEQRREIGLLQMQDIHHYKFFFFLRGNYESKLLLITSRNKSCIFFGKEQHSLILMYSEHMWKWHATALPEEDMM